MDRRAETVRIGELQLCVPGLNAGEGEVFGREVMQRVAQSLPAGGQHRTLGGLDLKLRVPAGTPRHRLAQTVADAILRGLKA